MKLKVKADYTSARFSARKSQTVEVDDELAQWLLRDAPGCFEEVKPKVRAKVVEEPEGSEPKAGTRARRK